MSDMEFYSDGFSGLEDLLKDIARNASEDKVLNAMEDAAEDLVADVRNLPKPRSQINKNGYTHLLDTVTTKRRSKEIEVGWGKYYGPMVERGTSRMRSQTHLRKTFEANKNKYYEKIIKKLFG